jgi:hypothetical protein
VAISFTTKLSGSFFVHDLIYSAEKRINYIFGGIPWKIYRCISRLPAEERVKEVKLKTTVFESH